MGTGTDRDFASLLDDLLVAPAQPNETSPPPSVSVDYLSVAEELHSGRIRVAADHAAAEYREAADYYEGGLAAFLANLERFAAGGAVDEELPPVDPEAIAAELGLGVARAKVDLGQLRRSFAFNNHPDRVAPHLRQRAMVRMQVANMLIDEARRGAGLSGKRKP